MAPRNNGADASYQKKTSPEERDIDLKDALPCLLHKKHKVVKLVKSQLQKIQQEGFYNANVGTFDLYFEEDATRLLETGKPGTSKKVSNQKPMKNSDSNRGGERRAGKNVCFFFYLVTVFLVVLLIIYTMVWIAAGPLSNSMAHTPIPCISFVRTDGICSLEKKYLLRWSKPEYFE